MQIVQRGEDQERRPPLAQHLRQPIGCGPVAGDHQVGDRLVGETEEDGVGLRHPQLGEGSERLGAPPAAEAGAVVRPDPEPPLDQTLRPRVVVAVGGEDDERPAAALQGALQQRARRQGLVVRVRCQEQETLAAFGSVPAHGPPPAGASGLKPRSAALAQITARRPPPGAGRNSCRPGARSRGPSNGVPSSVPRAVPFSVTTA